MVPRRRGSIVVTASTNAFYVEQGTAHYSATKGGVWTFVRNAALDLLHGASIVGTSSNLADRRGLAEDLERMGDAEVLVVELKAAAVDLAARVALERGMEVVFCDNRVVSVGGDATFEELALETADLAVERFSQR